METATTKLEWRINRFREEQVQTMASFKNTQEKLKEELLTLMARQKGTTCRR